jgi:hypothetical protein
MYHTHWSLAASYLLRRGWFSQMHAVPPVGWKELRLDQLTKSACTVQMFTSVLTYELGGLSLQYPGTVYQRRTSLMWAGVLLTLQTGVL